MLNIKTILVPTDFSPRSDYAFALAYSLARDHHSRLVVLTVVEPPAIAYGETIASLAQENHMEKARLALKQLTAPDEQVPVECRLEDGDPAAKIVEAARDTSCDLIVMGTHGWTGFNRLLMGSVAEQVVRKAPCPVLTIKTPLPETSAESRSPVAQKVG